MAVRPSGDLYADNPSIRSAGKVRPSEWLETRDYSPAAFLISAGNSVMGSISTRRQ